MVGQGIAGGRSTQSNNGDAISDFAEQLFGTDINHISLLASLKVGFAPFNEGLNAFFEILGCEYRCSDRRDNGNGRLLAFMDEGQCRLFGHAQSDRRAFAD